MTLCWRGGLKILDGRGKNMNLQSIPFSIVAMVIALTLSAPANAQAQAPGWSRGQQSLAISYNECLGRIQSALQAEGYRRDDQPGGNFAVGIKNPHTAVITCGPAPDSKMLVQIVVASAGDGGGSERQCLQAQMEQPGARRCGGVTTQSTCNSPAGTWNWWNGTVVTFLADGGARNNTGLTGNWRLAAGYVNVNWSNGTNAQYRWVDGNTLSEVYGGDTKTMRRSGPCGN